MSLTAIQRDLVTKRERTGMLHSMLEEVTTKVERLGRRPTRMSSASIAIRKGTKGLSAWLKGVEKKGKDRDQS